jgi:hypothetical protein
VRYNYDYTMYAQALLVVLKYTFQKTSNNILIQTSEKIETYPNFFHTQLGIAVRLLEQKDGLYYYVINPRFNAGFFLTKDSNKACVIS